MQLGAFSINLAVKDLEASRSFVAKLGFRATAGDASRSCTPGPASFVAADPDGNPVLVDRHVQAASPVVR